MPNHLDLDKCLRPIILQVHDAPAKVIPTVVSENQNAITLTYREPAVSQR